MIKLTLAVLMSLNTLTGQAEIGFKDIGEYKTLPACEVVRDTLKKQYPELLFICISPEGNA